MAEPNGQWLEQTERNLTDGFNGFLLGKHYVIFDRNPVFTQEFQLIF